MMGGGQAGDIDESAQGVTDFKTEISEFTGMLYSDLKETG
jgi:hypothetical protein